MKELNEYTAEVRERVEIRCKARRRQRARMLAVGVPLVLCLVVGALTLPRALRRIRSSQPTEARSEQVDEEALATGILAGGPDGALPDPVEEKTAEGERTDGITIGVNLPETSETASFRIVWGCYGISSYDSATGELVKTTDATHPEDYVTTLNLTDQQETELWNLLSKLDPDSYPEDYDPYNDPDSDVRMSSEPSRDLILTVRTEAGEKTIACRGICMGGAGLRGYDDRAQAFLEVCEGVTRLLEQTPEWQSLPDYEFYYE